MENNKDYLPTISIKKWKKHIKTYTDSESNIKAIENCRIYTEVLMMY